LILEGAAPLALTATPVGDGTSTTGQYCREFEQSITVGGETEQSCGVACRQPYGTWWILRQ